MCRIKGAAPEACGRRLSDSPWQREEEGSSCGGGRRPTEMLSHLDLRAKRSKQLCRQQRRRRGEGECNELSSPSARAADKENGWRADRSHMLCFNNECDAPTLRHPRCFTHAVLQTSGNRSIV